jgi:hypothetical protein
LKKRFAGKEADDAIRAQINAGKTDKVLPVFAGFCGCASFAYLVAGIAVFNDISAALFFSVAGFEGQADKKTAFQNSYSDYAH